MSYGFSRCIPLIFTEEMGMILSVSRRTDVPAWYSDWFFERLRAGYADVRNIEPGRSAGCR